VEALSEVNPQFRDWWAEHPVRYFRPAVIAVRHPEAGLIQLEMFQLRLVDQPGLIMVVQVPASKTYLARVRSLLPDTGQRPEPTTKAPGQGHVSRLPNRPVTLQPEKPRRFASARISAP